MSRSAADYHRRKPDPNQHIPHRVLARRFHEEAAAPDPDHGELSAIHRTLTRMEDLARTLQVCRSCYRRHTTSRSHRHCFITCRGPHHRAVLAPDPTGTLRLAFHHSPSLSDLTTELNRRIHLPPRQADAA